MAVIFERSPAGESEISGGGVSGRGERNLEAAGEENKEFVLLTKIKKPTNEIGWERERERERKWKGK